MSIEYRGNWGVLVPETLLPKFFGVSSVGFASLRVSIFFSVFLLFFLLFVDGIYYVSVAYKLSKRKTDDTLKMLHNILFGRRGKVMC